MCIDPRVKIERDVKGAASPNVTTVLIVDDSRAQRVLLRKSLEKWGYEVIEAASGEEALELCRSAPIPLVISDWMMPGMTGPEFCRAFHEAIDHPSYFILLTAQGDGAYLAEGLEKGADDFLSKPFNSTELKARLRAGVRVVEAKMELMCRNAQLADTLADLREINDAIDRDLVEARKLQQSLVPVRHEVFGATEVSLLYRPAGRIGGDLVGMFRAGANHLAAFSVDVAGHGIASALMTARIAGHLSAGSPDRNVALITGEDGELRMAGPEDVAHRMNDILLHEWDAEQYFTMALADIDLETGRVRLGQSGHPASLIQRRDGVIEFVDAPGMPIGLIPDAAFAQIDLRLNPGDRLLLYSDGLTECPDPKDVLLDEDGLSRIVSGLGDLRGEAFQDALYSALVDWRGDEDFPDDISAILIEFDTD